MAPAHLTELCGAAAARLRRVARHDAQVRADRFGDVCFVYHQEVCLRDARAPLSRDLIAAAHVDDVHDEVGELPGVVRREVVPAGLDEQQVGVVRLRELLERL